ncbi:hypothetical protein M4L39_10405 [Staphylococcus equorum]|uniref:Membrane protein YmcC n=1 Tax=Staphylococcus equorum TaxID=246432 RepID=A0A9X4LAV4_9STAP|nr:hypothetical protein [Staphylococcus equorum]MDG0843859.1 hypothetical protein [Staphylococcus equorum]MDG0860150.1 hypothetical protein [Staphylococcus equorum]
MNWVVYILIAAEILFWLVIALGLISRYILRLNKLGLFFFALTPLIDLTLIITMSIDLLNGAKATLPHGIAAVYIGASIVFGKRMIQWADVRFKYYILKIGELPVKKTGITYAKKYFFDWLMHALAYVIGTVLLWIIILIVGQSGDVTALYNVIKLWTVILTVDLLIALSNFIWLKPNKR